MGEADRGRAGPLVEMDHIVKTYRMGDADLEVLHGVSLTVEFGEYVAIMGPSGSGKSTLMHILGCLDGATAGHYRLEGRGLVGWDEDQLAPVRRRMVGFVFQSFNLLPQLTALDNVALPLLYQGVSAREQTERARAALAAVGLADRLRHRPPELSGGQQQRVAIARAVVTNAPMILADEPTGNLDSRAGREVLNIFARVHDEGRTVIVITHDLEVARHASRIIRLRDGEVVEEAGSAS